MTTTIAPLTSASGCPIFGIKAVELNVADVRRSWAFKKLMRVCHCSPFPVSGSHTGTFPTIRWQQKQRTETDHTRAYGVLPSTNRWTDQVWISDE
jgi:hypothetical protein